MSFEIFKPAAAAAGIVFVLFNLFFFLLVKRLSDRIWSVAIGLFVAVCIYTFIVGTIFESHAAEYLPDYLFKLFM